MRGGHADSELAGHGGRGPGTDAERRAAAWLATELRRSGHEVTVETFWCRPDWALAHAWHVALALGGSLLAVPVPWLGFALLAVALASLIADVLLGLSPGRRLTPERASQNVIAAPASEDSRTRFLIVANYDAGRTGLIRSAPRWLGWLTLITAWLAAIAVIRATHGASNVLRILQFVPTTGLVLTLALLLEAARAPFGPADDDTSTAVALALYQALVADPPKNLRPDLVLTGAHEGGSIGLRRYLRRHRHEITRSRTTVLILSASAGGISPAFVARTRRLRALTPRPAGHTTTDAALELVATLEAELGGAADGQPSRAIPV